MNNKERFAKKLQQLLDENNLTQADLVRMTGISKGAISSYLAGRYIPKQNNTYKIAKALNVTEAAIIDYGQNSRTEKPLINPLIAKTIRIMDTLTEDGKEVIASQAELVKASGKYDRPAEQVTAVFAQPTVTYSVARAAAGAGALNDGYAEPELRLIKSETIPTHDAVIDIVGDSMEPSIKDGDVAFICYNYEKKDGRLYAVNVGDETVIKRVYFYSGHSVLVSDNPAYEDRIITEADNASIAGEVVGWTTPIRE